MYLFSVVRPMFRGYSGSGHRLISHRFRLWQFAVAAAGTGEYGHQAAVLFFLSSTRRNASRFCTLHSVSPADPSALTCL